GPAHLPRVAREIDDGRARSARSLALGPGPDPLRRAAGAARPVGVRSELPAPEGAGAQRLAVRRVARRQIAVRGAVRARAGDSRLRPGADSPARRDGHDRSGSPARAHRRRSSAWATCAVVPGRNLPGAAALRIVRARSAKKKLKAAILAALQIAPA